MSRFALTSDFRAIFGEVRRQEVSDVARAATFIAALLLAWISLRPFIDLGDMLITDATTGNETWTYVAFGCFALLTVSLAMREGMRAFATLFSPGYLAIGAWVAATVVMSLEPATSLRRFVLTLCVIAVAASLMLLPKTQTELRQWLASAILTLLAACYLGVLLAPHLSIHLATDAQEPALAGAWRLEPDLRRR